jgi:hypothetical protein
VQLASTVVPLMTTMAIDARLFMNFAELVVTMMMIMMMIIIAAHHFIDASDTRTVAVSFTVAAIFPSLAAIIEFITKRVTQFKFASAFCKSNSGLRSWHWS